MKADAVVFTGPNKVEFLRVDCPDPGPNEAVVRVTHSWISNGTEGSYLRGERIGGDIPYKSGGPYPFPIVPGYQKVGIVERVGDRIKDLSVGETVFAASSRVSGMFVEWSGHVSPAVTPREQIWKLPSSPEPLAFSGLLLTQVGYNCGSRAPIEPGEYAVVVGDGLVGQWTAQTLSSRGAKVAMVGMEDYRLAHVENLTGCSGINLATTDWPTAVKDMVPEGLAVAVDTVGSRGATETLINLMRRGGHIVSAGFCGTDDKISLQTLRDQEISLDSVSGMKQDRMDCTLELIAGGTLQTLPLITHCFPVADVAEAWRVINERKEPVLGVVLDWSI